MNQRDIDNAAVSLTCTLSFVAMFIKGHREGTEDAGKIVVAIVFSGAILLQFNPVNY